MILYFSKAAAAWTCMGDVHVLERNPIAKDCRPTMTGAIVARRQADEECLCIIKLSHRLSSDRP